MCEESGEENYLLLMEKGRLSPGGGRPSPPLLMAEVVKFLVDMTARLATWANILGLKYYQGQHTVVWRGEKLFKNGLKDSK